MNDLHLYVEIKENETVDAATKRTHSIVEDTFKSCGFSIHEIGENEDQENEIKAFLSVDASEEEIYKLGHSLNVQIY